MPRRTIKRLAVTLALGFAFSSSVALAWNSPGHMIIALVAYDQMDDATKKEALALLHAHPRYEDHFERAQRRAVEKGTDAEKDQWLFAYAATWSDVVRTPSGSGGRGGGGGGGEGGGGGGRSTGAVVTRDDVDAYSRPWWHFIDEPVYLSEAEEQKLASTITVNRNRDVPAKEDDPDMNVIQAIKYSAHIVGDKSAPAEKRSVHLCWLLHLVGDSHQPLHSSALFTSHRYPEGDHGGNYLSYNHQFPLHSYWDGVIANEESYETVRRLAHDLSQNVELAAAGEKAASQLDAGAWIDEGHALAKKYVYTPDVMKKIAGREGHTHLGDLNPSPQYEADAENVSEQQAVVAAHRLAKLLQQLLK